MSDNVLFSAILTNTLPSSVRDSLDGILANLWPDRPVRVIRPRVRSEAGVGRDYRTYGWDDDQWSGINDDTQECVDRGVTIILNQSFGSGRQSCTAYFPIDEWFPEGRPSFLGGREYFTLPMNAMPRIRPVDAEPIEVPYYGASGVVMADGNYNCANGRIGVGDYQERVVTIHSKLDGLHDYVEGGMDLTRLFGETDDDVREFASNVVDPTFFDALQDRAQARARTEFVALLRERNQAGLRDVELNLTRNATRLAELQREEVQVQNLLRAQQAQRDAIVEATEGANITEADLEREFDIIMRHANVENIELRPNQQMVVTTNELMLPHPYGRMEDAVLGEFELMFDFNGNSVTANNTTNARGDRDHPHVVNGSFCYGNWGRQVQTLFEARQLAACVNFVLEALHTCNPDDSWGRTYTRWFQ